MSLFTNSYATRRFVNPT